MANFILFQTHADARIATIYKSTTEQLGQAYKDVRPGFNAWLVPTAVDKIGNWTPESILRHCEIKVVGGLAKKIR